MSPTPPTPRAPCCSTSRPRTGLTPCWPCSMCRAPWWDAEARGAIFGLTRDAGAAEIAAATFDSCVFQGRDLIEAMRADAPSAFEDAALRIDGGMAKSAWFSQRLADLT